MAMRCRHRVRRVDARAAAVIRIDAMWLAVEPVDMRAGADCLLARVVQEATQCVHIPCNLLIVFNV